MTTCLESHTPAAPSTPNPSPQKSLSRWPVLLLLCHYKPFTGCPLLSIHKKGFIPFATSCLYDTKQWIARAGTWNPPAQPGKCPFLLTPSQLLEEQRHRERTHYRITSLWLHCSRFSKLMAYEIEAIKKTLNKTKITTMSIFVVGFSFPRSCLVSYLIHQFELVSGKLFHSKEWQTLNCDEGHRVCKFNSTNIYFTDQLNLFSYTEGKRSGILLHALSFSLFSSCKVLTGIFRACQWENGGKTRPVNRLAAHNSSFLCFALGDSLPLSLKQSGCYSQQDM